MSTVPPASPAPNEVVSDQTLHFDYPGSDIILRSHDSHDFRVPQLYLVNVSPVLRELIRVVSDTSDVPNGEEQEALPVVKLPESGATLYSLLTFVFPVLPVLPSTTERVMELLAVAQKYQMDSVLDHIRGAISRQDPPFIRPETALYVYFLAQKYELHQEALRAARSTLRLSMTIENLVDDSKIDFMPGAYLRALWKYHERVRKDLSSSLRQFGKLDVSKDMRCGTQGYPESSSTTTPIPHWLENYIESIVQAPHLFDLAEFENARACHIKDKTYTSRPTACSCVDISSQAIRAFWDALTVVVHGSIERADVALALVKEVSNSEIWYPSSMPLSLNAFDANVLIRSSDQANFRVHKSLLAMSSPFFNDLFSLPQPADGELVDGLPVVQLSEDAGLLESLVSLLYPITPAIPGSYRRVFALLAACQKYDMASIQSYIRAEMKHGTFPAPDKADGFRAYAIASSMGLIPEMESAAHLTLNYSMSFTSLGEELRFFEGRALCDLVRYRKRRSKVVVAKTSVQIRIC